MDDIFGQREREREGKFVGKEKKNATSTMLLHSTRFDVRDKSSAYDPQLTASASKFLQLKFRITRVTR